MKSVFLSGYYGFGNLGDELILKNIAALFKEVGVSSIYAVSGNLEYSRAKHPGIEFISRDDYPAIVDIVKRVDLVALGGGGLFQDYNRLETANLFESPKMGVHSYINVPLVARIYEKPVAYLFQGIGPLYSEDSRNFTKYAYSLCNYISVRDKDSARLLEEIGIRDVVLSADPTFLYPVEHVKTKRGKQTIGISLRQWVDKSVEDRIASAVADFLNRISGDYDFYFISFQDHDDQNTDSAIYERIRSNLKREGNFALIRSKDYSLEGIEKLVADLDLLIGMRLHSIVLAMKYGIPFLALPYWNKVEALLAETGLDDLSINMKEISGEKIEEKFVSLVSESFDIKKRIEKGTVIIEGRLNYGIKTMKDFFIERSDSGKAPLPVEKPDDKAPLPADWVNYKAYQEKLKRQFYKNRYSRFTIDRILRRSRHNKIIFYPSPILWDVPLFQRPHQIFKELSKRGYLIFFLPPDPAADRAEPIREINENLYLIKDIDILYGLRDEAIILWITWTPNIVCKELFPNSIVVYDWIDELDIFGYYSKFMEIDHRKLLLTADVVLATSDSLLEEAKTLRSDALLVPNGVCLEDFAVGEDVIPEDMATVLAKGKPVIGFYGLLGDWRVDYDLLNYLSGECRDLNFVLIGPCYDGSTKKLKAADNLFLLGPKKYEELKYYLKHFDVAMIPYKVDRITNSVFPVKLCEYMAGGKSIVTTNMKECRKFKSVLVSENRDDFVQNIRRALLLKNDMDYLKILTEEAYSNRWEDRVDKIIRALKSERVLEPAGKERLEERLSIAGEEIEAMQKILDQSIYEIDVLNSELTRTIDEKDNLIEEKDNVLNQLNQALAQTIAEKDNQLNEIQSVLNGIYSSNFWKVASFYYRAREKSIVVKGTYLFLKWVKRKIEFRNSSGSVSKFRSHVKKFGVKSAVKKSLLRIIGRDHSQIVIPDAEAKDVLAVIREDKIPSSAFIGNKYDIFFFPMINFSFRYQRPQQLASHFAKMGHRVFYMNISELLSLDSEKDFKLKVISENLYEVLLKSAPLPNIYGERLGDGASKVLHSSINALRRQWGLTTLISIVHNPFWSPLGFKLKRDFGWKVVYDCLDDWDSDMFKGIRQPLLDEEKNLVKEADLLTVTSELLYKKWYGQNRSCTLVRNAADYEHFVKASPNNLLRDISKPVLGFFGGIADWLDIDMIHYAATKRKDWSFVLIGGIFTDVSSIKKLPNVRLPDNQPYMDMPSYLYNFDVCLIPFKKNKVTEAVDPVKLYEYFSSGKPVVARDLYELRRYKDCVYLYDNDEEFVEKIERALNEKDTELKEKRKAVAASNTWHERIGLIDRRVKDLYGKVSVIIVTFNNVKLNKLCLESILAKTDYPNYEIVVVDNHSTDGTTDYLRTIEKRFDFIKVVLNDKNEGFPKANNQGINVSDGHYIVFLNNDTIVTKGWLTKFTNYLDKYPEIGLIGPVTNFCGNEAKIDSTYKDLREMDYFAYSYAAAHETQFFDIKVLAFYCVAMRREIIEMVGLLDEHFGIGMFEDDDYARRVKLKGYRVVCAEDIFIHHFGQGAFKKLIENGEYRKLFDRNKRLFEKKWGVKWEAHRHRTQKVISLPD
jgi:polysaccharide pyruvyl transferase CsaB